jgi:hypothetical protein
LSVYSIETGELKKPYAGSSEIKGIRSFPYPKEPEKSESIMWEWFICNDFYKSVFYDKYKNVYYRMAQLPVDEYVQGYNGNEKPTIIVVLDSDMNYLGEALLPKAKFEYEMHSCFVSPDGFNIQVNTDNDDMLTFYTYTFLPDEKDEK